MTQQILIFRVAGNILSMALLQAVLAQCAVSTRQTTFVTILTLLCSEQQAWLFQHPKICAFYK